MTKEDCRKHCIYIYQEFYKAVNLMPDYDVVMTNNDSVMLDKFVDSIGKRYDLNTIGVNFLIEYNEFSFNYWMNRETRFGFNVIMLNWIYGIKAWTRYIDFKDKKWRFNKYKNYIKTDVKFNIYNKLSLQKDSKFISLLKNSVININKIEEKDKQRYHNTEEGLAWCISMTTLYNHLSEQCLFCNHSNDCKQILKKNFYNLYKLRGYER